MPVLVVGNLTVGGAGKTPLTIELARRLRARGWHPGIVSRGYGAENRQPRMVDLRGNTADYGDEPVLISMATQLPVAVGAQRSAAGKLLLNLHPDRDLIIADDGLQHRRLARDVEIAVIHGDSLGNGWLLPAGPLRESPERLRSVDLVVFHGAPVAVRVHSPFFVMQSDIAKAQSLVDTSARHPAEGPRRRAAPQQPAAGRARRHRASGAILRHAARARARVRRDRRCPTTTTTGSIRSPAATSTARCSPRRTP